MEYDQLKKELPLAEKGRMKLGLKNITSLMALFDNVQDQLPTVHIAGTNGKGSTAAMTANILQKAGYKVGLFTSPALVDFNERIQINQQPVSDELLLAAVDRVKSALKDHPEVQMTEFELFTCLAWLIFAHEACDIVVLEVGLGGRLDATNLVKKPLVTAIAKIALDHEKILGSTLEEIAGEKAGILKAGAPLALYPNAEGPRRVILDRARSLKIPVHEVQEDELSYELTTSAFQLFEYKGKAYELSLAEEHQILNACLAIEICRCLEEGGLELGEEAIRKGLKTVRWPARFERIQTQPDVVIDGSHNLDGIQDLKKSLLRYYPEGPRLAICAMLKDKVYWDMLECIIPAFDGVITITADTPRALTSRELAADIVSMDLLPKEAVKPAQSLEEACRLAQDWLDRQKQPAMLLGFGSLYFVGYLRLALLKNPLKDSGK